MVKISLIHVQTSGGVTKQPAQDPFPWPQSWWGKVLQATVIAAIVYGLVIAMF